MGRKVFGLFMALGVIVLAVILVVVLIDAR